MQDTLKANPCIYTALAKHFTNIVWGHAPFSGELLVHDCPLSGDLFLLSNLSVLKHSFKPFPRVLSPEESSTSLAAPTMGRCSQQWGPSLSLFSELDKPHILSCSSEVLPSNLFTILVSSFGHILVFLYTSYTVRPKTGHSTRGGAHNTSQVIIRQYKSWEQTD